jgi:glycosyltransferase involved in cell wall biosynthesis
VVAGFAASFPFGGVFWDYFHFVLGLKRLGHDVLYIEDTGKWCYDPRQQTFVESGARNVAYLAKQIAKLDPELSERWFYRDGAGATYGRPWSDVVEFCRSADLFLHVSGSALMREEYFAPRRVVFIDTDPIYTQASFIDALGAPTDDPERDFRRRTILRHHVFFTFAENIGRPGCTVPSGPFTWIPMHHPIVIEALGGAVVLLSERRRVLTTIASWEPAEKPVVLDGVTYCGKSVEYERLLGVPSMSPVPIELAMSGPAPYERLRAARWQIVDGYGASRDPWAYRDYIAHSFGEFSIAKNAYVQSRSGWFSGRSGCYLALGVPVIVQDTGFACALPTGDGILPFSTAEEARAAILRLLSEPERHARAASEIAREYFAADKVLNDLIDRALGAQAPKR